MAEQTQFSVDDARAWLLAERNRVQQGIQARKQGDEEAVTTDPALAGDGETGTEADNADALADYDRTQLSIESAQDVLRQINAALERIDNGTYGKCARCGKPIPPARLRALPYALYDVACAEIVEREQGGEAAGA